MQLGILDELCVRLRIKKVHCYIERFRINEFIMKYLICFAVIFIISNSFLECKKSEARSCGCSSPVISSLNSAEGTLYYDSSLKQYDISAAGPGIDGTISVICDTSLSGLKPFLDSARIQSLRVTISGQIMKDCLSDTIIYIGDRNNINITQISY